MSSTNVHSENLTCAGAQIIPTEKNVEIPPKTAKLGPTRMSVISGDHIEIPVEESSLNKDGKLVNKDGNIIAEFSKKQVQDIERAKKLRDKSKNANKEVDQEK